MSWRWPCSLLLTVVLAGAGACGAGPAPAPATGVVARVHDGDTLSLTDGRRVRLLGIDAPELEKEGRPAEFLAHAAKKALSDLTQGRRVRLEYDRLRYDRFQRLLAYVHLEDGTLVNRELVARGLARVYTQPPNTARQEELLAAQREALEAGRGIWREALTQDEDFYLANQKTQRFHRPNCHLAREIAPANRLRLDSKKEAYLRGFSPCRTCKP